MVEFKQMSQVRVRIAPSPTGIPHIGTTRTALFNWLFAKHHKGKFVVRIEDTDRARLVPESLPKILEIFRWLGLDWDEGPEVGGPHEPYIQSQRLSLYQKLAKKLVAEKKAYYCFCSPERLEKMRKAQQKEKKPPRYDRHCLKLKPEEVEEKLKKETPFVIRLKIPDSGITSWKDLIHGGVSFENRLLDDQVLVKSDGYPTYHLAVVADDHLMRITHVLRGVEWISSTPKHILLYQAFGWKLPLFGHLPLILGPDKAKLSKRHGAKSALDYRDEGYLPEALLNFMLLLGWSPKSDKEIFSREEMIEAFDLEGVSLTNPIFDLKKLDWLNGQYIRKLPTGKLAQRLKPFIPKDWDLDLVKKIAPLEQERLVKLTDFANLADFFFKEKLEYDKNLLIQKGKTSEETKKVLSIINYQLSIINYQDWTHYELEKIGRSLVEETNWSSRDLFMTLRVAVSGKIATPPLFETMEVLGREKCLKRTQKAVKKLS